MLRARNIVAAYRWRKSRNRKRLAAPRADEPRVVSKWLREKDDSLKSSFSSMTRTMRRRFSFSRRRRQSTSLAAWQEDWLAGRQPLD